MRLKHNLRVANGVRTGFTLLELLVVIAIIGILAGMLMTSFGGASKAKNRSRIQTQMQEIEASIGEYQAKRGSFPPSNPTTMTNSTLYFELVGTLFNRERSEYRTLDGKTVLPLAKKTEYFGKDIQLQNSGLRNEDVENFYRNLKPTDFFVDGEGRTLLGVPVKSTEGLSLKWRYNSFNPTNNPGRYDLWVEWAQKVGDQPEIIGNWKN